jgi:hypothetical protein
MADKKVIINYTSRNFNSIKRDLEEHAKVYYPDTYKDFSENSFGSYILDAVSYVGDMLSYYIDYQVNESFLETAIEYDNVRRISRQYGYNYAAGRPAAYGMATLYVMVPASSTGLGPDLEYIPILKRGTQFSSTTGASFILTEDVNFQDPRNGMVAARYSNTTNRPTHYAIQSQGQVRSLLYYLTEESVGAFQRFRKIRVGPSSISEIDKVVDSAGNEYFQVENLSQDVIYTETTNPNARAEGVRSILKPKVVPRRYVVTQDAGGTYIQFGFGSDEEISTTDITDPAQVALKMSGRPYINDYAFDPTQLLNTNTLGIGPSNTTLKIYYFANDADSINLNAGSLTAVVEKAMVFPNETNSSLNTTQASVINSLEVTNDEPIVGNTSLPTADEIRLRSYASYASQKRAVTRNDYEAYCYMMPASLGSVKRASIINDPSSSNRRLSLYVISEDGQNNLIPTNATIKTNLRTWLIKNKMLNDSIDIYDAKILNFGFDYKIIVNPEHDRMTVINNVNRRLREQMSEKMYIGEPLYITNIYNIINKTEGVVDTIDVSIRLMSGTGYNTAPVSIDQLLSKDGTFLKTPKNVVLEIKNFEKVVRGSAR